MVSPDLVRVHDIVLRSGHNPITAGDRDRRLFPIDVRARRSVARDGGCSSPGAHWRRAPVVQR
uniref:Uncharacterized protein n=1 Tax=uncultured Nocardioidaceae bacterium TaxID=253824 RepID=A0A6J4L5N7_9ACTN|nr:MAG: hypothetical protein AVDCRST_MAG46-986 [uncultured Nocardioidaceae bacterium]